MNTESIEIYNIYQFLFYIKHNVFPTGYKTSERDGKVGFVFKKQETKGVYKLWMSKER